MQFISDYALSVTIAGLILLVALSLKLRGEQSSVEATQFRAAKLSTLSLVETLERDFNNIGAQFLPGTHLPLNPDNALNAFDPDAVPAHFEFLAQTDSTQPARVVRYEWQESGRTVQLARGEVPLFDVERFVDGALDGRSTNMITGLEIHLLRADSTGITNLMGAGADTQLILVRLTAVSPLGPGDSIEELRWEKVFRPPNLWKRRDL